MTVSRLFLQGKDIDFVNAILEKIANHLSQGEDKDGILKYHFNYKTLALVKFLYMINPIMNG